MVVRLEMLHGDDIYSHPCTCIHALSHDQHSMVLVKNIGQLLPEFVVKSFFDTVITSEVAIGYRGQTFVGKLLYP